MYGVIVDYLLLEVRSLNMFFLVLGVKVDVFNILNKKLWISFLDVYDSGK